MPTAINANSQNTEPKNCKCKWEGCEGTPHTTIVKYNEEENGSTTRGKYVGNWPHPSYIRTDSYTKYGVREGKHKGLKSSKYALKKYESERADYKIEQHHVVPVDALKSKKKFAKNLKLVGWNINDGIYNGICLPYFKEDQIWHCLQPHRGSHPRKYVTDAKEALSALESDCEKYCKESEKPNSKINQEDLLAEMIVEVEDLRSGILNWTIYIHKPTTLKNWTAGIMKKKLGSKTGYFLQDAEMSSIPKMENWPYSGRTYLT